MPRADFAADFRLGRHGFDRQREGAQFVLVHRTDDPPQAYLPVRVRADLMCGAARRPVLRRPLLTRRRLLFSVFFT